MWGAPSTVPGAPGPPSGPRLTQLFALQPFYAKVRGSRSNSPKVALNGKDVSPEGPFPLGSGSLGGCWDTHLVTQLGSLKDFPESPLPTQWEGAEQRHRQNRMWVTEVSQPGRDTFGPESTGMEGAQDCTQQPCTQQPAL